MILLVSHTYAQQIQIKDQIADTSNFGEKLHVGGCYDSDTKLITIEKYSYDKDAIHIFIHELGHHIWSYGGVDTTAILNDLKGDYFTRSEIMELFAEEHWRYFWGQANPAFKKIFDRFYNRDSQ